MSETRRYHFMTTPTDTRGPETVEEIAARYERQRVGYAAKDIRGAIDWLMQRMHTAARYSDVIESLDGIARELERDATPPDSEPTTPTEETPT